MKRLLLLFVFCFFPALNVQAGNPSPISPPEPPPLSNLNFTTPLDVAGGEKALQITLDTAAALQTSVSLQSSPSPQLMLTLSNASALKLPKELKLDGKISSGLSVTQKNLTTVLLTIKLQQPLTPADYRISSDDPQGKEPGRVKLTITKPLIPLPLTFSSGLNGKSVFLDPGHGGSDPGAVGPSGALEKNITLAVALKTKDLLEKAGAKVTLTRSNDKDVFAANASGADELGARALLANRSQTSAVFLSLHADSFADRSVSGSSSFYFVKTPYDQLLAQNLQKSVVAASGLPDRGIQSANFFVLKRTRIPAALLEIGFVSNPLEEKLLTSAAMQDKIARGIVGGLYNFFAQAAKPK